MRALVPLCLLLTSLVLVSGQEDVNATAGTITVVEADTDTGTDGATNPAESNATTGDAPITESPTEAHQILDTLYTVFKDNYPFFDVRLSGPNATDWDTRYSLATEALDSKLARFAEKGKEFTDVALYDILSDMLDGLHDGHVVLQTPRGKQFVPYTEAGWVYKCLEEGFVEPYLWECYRDRFIDNSQEGTWACSGNDLVCSSLLLDPEPVKAIDTDTDSDNSTLPPLGMLMLGSFDIAFEQDVRPPPPSPEEAALDSDLILEFDTDKSGTLNVKEVLRLQRHLDGDTCACQDSAGQKCCYLEAPDVDAISPDQLNLWALTVEEHLATMADAGVAGIVIDLRFNGGGYDELALAMLSRVVWSEGVAFTKAQYDPPGSATFGNETEVTYVPEGGMNNYFGNIPIAVLQSKFTFSAAEVFGMSVRPLYPRIFTVGDTTGGSFSDVYTYSLGGGWEVELGPERYTAMQHPQHGGGPAVFEGLGLPPDFGVPFSSKSVDDQLVKAMSLLRQPPVLKASLFDLALTFGIMFGCFLLLYLGYRLYRRWYMRIHADRGFDFVSVDRLPE